MWSESGTLVVVEGEGWPTLGSHEERDEYWAEMTTAPVGLVGGGSLEDVGVYSRGCVGGVKQGEEDERIAERTVRVAVVNSQCTAVGTMGTQIY